VSASTVSPDETVERGGLMSAAGAVKETRTPEFERAIQRAERPGILTLDFEPRSAALTVRLRGQKRFSLLLGQVLLDSFEELLGLRECQAQMLDPFGIFL
jgi:hypothetical protein